MKRNLRCINHSFHRGIRFLFFLILACTPLYLSGCNQGGDNDSLPQSTTPAAAASSDAAEDTPASSDTSSDDSLDTSTDAASDASVDPSDSTEAVVKDFPMPEASGTAVQSEAGIQLDYSNANDGYIMITYTGEADLCRVRITDPSAITYDYYLHPQKTAAFPLSGGSGSYVIDTYEHAYDNMYAVLTSIEITANITDEFLPFLYPNQYVWFTKDSAAITYAAKLYASSSDELGYVTAVYDYIIGNITYDDEKAATVAADYIPDIDETLSTDKGICFDYAALMAAMLRCESIPTKLVTGYSGTAFHAWISVYLTERGWVNNIIEFDGSSWSLMDPTLAANNNASAVKDYIGDGSNYTEKFYY